MSNIFSAHQLKKEFRINTSENKHIHTKFQQMMKYRGLNMDETIFNQTLIYGYVEK